MPSPLIYGKYVDANGVVTAYCGASESAALEALDMQVERMRSSAQPIPRRRSERRNHLHRHRAQRPHRHPEKDGQDPRPLHLRVCTPLPL